MTQNLKERILKLRKSVRPSGPKAVKANFFTPEGLPLCSTDQNIGDVRFRLNTPSQCSCESEGGRL